jgi:ABC-type dipeptide/oligopeptide/nickel transport system permease subunit
VKPNERPRSPRARVGAALLLCVIALCAVGPPLLGLDAETTAPEQRLEAPSLAHPFGTDAVGRDLFARVLLGGRTSLLVGFAATLVSVGIGVLYGAVAGYRGGRLDDAMMRVVDFLYAIPYMFLVILVMLLFRDTARGRPLPVFLALGLVQWLTLARIVRGEALRLRGAEFVQALRVLGASDARILLRHVLPNAFGPIVVYGALTVPHVILLESFLSFLGLGIDLSWGQLVAEGVAVVNPIASPWWLLAAPAAFLATTLLALQLLGDALRDALDARLAR